MPFYDKSINVRMRVSRNEPEKPDLYMSYFAYACKTEGKNYISRLISETA